MSFLSYSSAKGFIRLDISVLLGLLFGFFGGNLDGYVSHSVTDDETLKEVLEYYDKSHDITKNLNWGDQKKSNHLHLGLFNVDGSYDEKSLKILQEKMVYECFRNLQFDHKIILEVGCGLGGPLLTLLGVNSTVQVHGVDFSKKIIESATATLSEFEEYTERCSLFEMDAHHLTFKNNTYDGVFLIECLEHMNQSVVLQEIFRVLKNNGFLSMCVYCRKDQLDAKDEVFFDEIGHMKLVLWSDYLYLLHNIGFRDVEIKDLTDRIYSNFEYFYPEEKRMRELIKERKIGYMKISATAVKSAL